MKRRHTLMLLVTRTRPEVTNLLGFDITRGKRRTLKRRSRDLQNRQRRSIVRQDLSDTRDAGDQRRKGEALAQRNQGCQRCNSRLHFDSSFLKNGLDLVSIFERVFPGLYRRSMPPSLAVFEQVLISFSLLSFPSGTSIGGHFTKHARQEHYHWYCKRDIYITKATSNWKIATTIARNQNCFRIRH